MRLHRGCERSLSADLCPEPIERTYLLGADVDAELPRRAANVLPFVTAKEQGLAQRSASRHCDDVLAALNSLEVEGTLDFRPICPSALLLLPRSNPMSGSRTRDSSLYPVSLFLKSTDAARAQNSSLICRVLRATIVN